MRLGGRGTLPPAQPSNAHALSQRCQPLRSDDGTACWLGCHHRPGLPPLTRIRSHLPACVAGGVPHNSDMRFGVWCVSSRTDPTAPARPMLAARPDSGDRPVRTPLLRFPVPAALAGCPTSPGRRVPPVSPCRVSLSGRTLAAGVLRATGPMPYAAPRAGAGTALSRLPARLGESGRLQRRQGAPSRRGPGQVMRRWFSHTGVPLPAPRAKQPGRAWFSDGPDPTALWGSMLFAALLPSRVSRPLGLLGPTCPWPPTVPTGLGRGTTDISRASAMATRVRSKVGASRVGR